MPNIKSSIRSVKTDAERLALTETGTQEDAKATYVTASGLIDKAARKGIIHKNAANRRKSRLAKKVNAME